MKRNPPQSGIYEGYYSEKGGKREAFECELRWSGLEFRGDGVDGTENFTISGTIENAPPWKVGGGSGSGAMDVFAQRRWGRRRAFGWEG